VRLRPTLTVPDYEIARTRHHLGTSRKALDGWFELAQDAAIGNAAPRHGLYAAAPGPRLARAHCPADLRAGRLGRLCAEFQEG
jgi:hypothetical protein